MLLVCNGWINLRVERPMIMISATMFEGWTYRFEDTKDVNEGTKDYCLQSQPQQSLLPTPDANRCRVRLPDVLCETNLNCTSRDILTIFSIGISPNLRRMSEVFGRLHTIPDRPRRQLCHNAAASLVLIQCPTPRSCRLYLNRSYASKSKPRVSGNYIRFPTYSVVASSPNPVSPSTAMRRRP
jgi:hypothetical protein